MYDCIDHCLASGICVCACVSGHRPSIIFSQLPDARPFWDIVLLGKASQTHTHALPCDYKHLYLSYDFIEPKQDTLCAGQHGRGRFRWEATPWTTPTVCCLSLYLRIYGELATTDSNIVLWNATIVPTVVVSKTPVKSTPTVWMML